MMVGSYIWLYCVKGLPNTTLLHETDSKRILSYIRRRLEYISFFFLLLINSLFSCLFAVYCIFVIFNHVVLSFQSAPQIIKKDVLCSCMYILNKSKYLFIVVSLNGDRLAAAYNCILPTYSLSSFHPVV